MNRISFLKNLLGVSLIPTATVAAATAKPSVTPPNLAAEAQRVRQELLAAWKMSEKMSLVTASQMPAEHYGFKYASDAFTYARQWKHCCDFTINQLASRLSIANPYGNNNEPEKMDKAAIQAEVKMMYAWVRKAIETTPDAALFANSEYLGDDIPTWRLFYAMENHIIHHRGQCMVYLRMKGVTPEGYIGW
ncbi:MAG: DinB family protein [Cytophagales bacterium]|nr:MAG: DinB family protein [Cytophagales bacterium]